MRHLLVLLLLCWPSLVLAQEDGALSIRIDTVGTGDLVLFPEVVFRNNSDKPIRIYHPNSKRGYHQLSFVFEDKKTFEDYQVHRRKIETAEEWQEFLGDLLPDDELLEIAPGKEIAVKLKEWKGWTGLPDPNDDRAFRVWALFTSDSTSSTPENHIWTGQISSRFFSTPFWSPHLNSPSDFARYGFTDKAIKLIEARGLEDLEEDAKNGLTLEHAAHEYAHATGNWQKKQWQRIVQTLLDLGATYDLYSAIYMNDLNRVKEILKEFPEQANGDQWRSPLRCAASSGYFEISQYLLENFDVDVDDFERGLGYPIIKHALKYPKIVKLLIDHGADLKTRITWHGNSTGIQIIFEGATALHHAADAGVPETIKLLIDHGINIMASTGTIPGTDLGQTALHVAAFFGKAENAKAIVNHPKFQEIEPTIRRKLLNECLIAGSQYTWFAREQNRPPLVELFLEAGADPNYQTEDGDTSVRLAAEGIHPHKDEEIASIKKTVEVLRKHGAKIDLFTAVAIEDEQEVARILKETPKAANARSPRGCPALQFAVKMQNVEIVKLLIAAGVDLEMKNQDESTSSDTALDDACCWAAHVRPDEPGYKEYREIIELLDQAAKQK